MRHATETPQSKNCGAILRTMEELGVITDTNVAASNTKEAFKTAISTALDADTQHGERSPLESGFLRVVDDLYAIGDVNDTTLAACTSVDDLVALTALTNESNRRVSNIQ